MSNGSTWFALAPETIGRVVAPISPFRNRAGTQPIGDWSHCGMPGYMLCWSWEGSAHLEFERLPADLTLQQNPDTAIWAGQTVTFTAGADPATVAGNPWPIGVMELQWRWIPDDSVSADTLGCGSASGMKCTRVMRGSGTMYAAAYVNGMQQQKSIHLTIKVPELHLTASKYVVAAPGENDTFTATANGSLTVLGWSFTPDGGGADRLEVSAASIIGRFGRARFTTNIAGGQSATSGLLAVPATSRKLASSGSVWDACLSGSTQCTNLVTEAGTVDILAIVNGDTLRASVHVNVVPCPTDDPVLDDPGIRRALKDLILRSKPDLDNGDGIAPGDSIGNKRELAGDIFQRPDGTYYFVEDTLLWSTECKGKRSNLDLRKDPADVKVGDVHTHPDNQLMQAYGCGMVNGVLTQRGPWDTTSGRSPTTKPRDSDNGGGSIEDWMRLALLPENSPPADPTAPPKPKRVDGYILNADGEVWKIPKEMLDFHAPMSSNTQHWRWRLNGNPACNW